MTSAAIRQSFLDFFGSLGHLIVPSSSPPLDSPALLFTYIGPSSTGAVIIARLGQAPPCRGFIFGREAAGRRPPAGGGR